jgi:3'-phosphoadenosine 5'-phosphosulfate sulfotransferase (PAPS reductase)/FAD synthetase
MPFPPDIGHYPKPDNARPNTVDLLPLNEYDHIIVSFSGGKDSTALVLRLLDLGVPLERIELWHESVDGLPGDQRFMDWPCTEGYVSAFAEALGVPLMRQAKVGGFRGELLREGVPTAPTVLELPDGEAMTRGGAGNPGTRLKFPAKAADLRVRWCSAVLKIDPARKAFANDPRFQNAKTLFLTGERRQESGARSRYAEAEAYSYAPSKGRRVDQWRAILSWAEEQVWEIISRYRIRPHPAYYLGWGRLSCLSCIFGNEDQWASVVQISPGTAGQIAELEEAFHDYWALRYSPARREPGQKPFLGTIWPGGQGIYESAAKGTTYLRAGDDAMIALAMSEGYPVSSIRLDLAEQWELPRGAFKKSGGPT